MRILVLGAGATGGYFGGRLLEKGEDVTFLVRPARAARLAAEGLSIISPAGDYHHASPRTVTADTVDGYYDLVILSCKAYDLDQAMHDIAAAVGPATTILPVLNGMQHLDRLDERFGAPRVLGGLCFIAATLDADGTVRHLGNVPGLTYGERDGSLSPRMQMIAKVMEGVRFKAHASAHIQQDMWNKWVFLATLAGITCLMRATIGEIVAATGGREAILKLLDTCREVARYAGFAPPEHVIDGHRAMLTEADSKLTASMLRDLEGGKAVEADHIIGDMLARAEPTTDVMLLRTAYVHLKAYEQRRQRS